MRIRELFRNNVGRRIEEVVKVDVLDDRIVAGEIDEYVVTPRIEDGFHDVLDVYRETIGNPSGQTNLWVSGFFGSGKSSFAKVLGYLLENRAVGSGRAGDLFFPHCKDQRIEALLRTSWELAPALTVFLELSSSQDVTNESEGIVLPLYRALLARLDYAEAPKLAALEFDLETEGRLDAFESAFREVNGREWKDSRHSTLSVNLASAALHRLDQATFPFADSWAKAFEVPPLNPKWFAQRAVELVSRRGGGAVRLVFVVDEVSQYIARSIDRIRAMQGVAEEFQRQRGRIWLVATGQERLEEVVEGLEGKQSELQRLRARFPLTIDLLPSDIRQVVSERVLDKDAPGQQAVRAALAPHRQKLAANIRLVSETRAEEPSEDDLVKLYPLLPYQVQLLIDAVSKRRSQVRSSAPMGGSNRTIIKHAQQLIASAKVGLGNDEIGPLATIDRSYDLLEEVIPTSWRAEVQQVAEKYKDDPTPVQVMKAIALVHDVGSLPLTAHNLAVLLHPSISAESRRDEVAAALGKLVQDDRIREVDGRYQLQSVEQKQWEQERKNIALGLGDEVRLRKVLLGKTLKALTISQGRTFSIGVSVDSEVREQGEIMLEVIASTHAEHRDDLRQLSRESTSATRVFWIFDANEVRAALEQLHKSERMLERRDVASKTTADGPLIADEKTRQARAERQVLDALSAALSKGDVIFRGRLESVPPGEIRAVAQAVVRDRLGDIYPLLDSFATSVETKDLMVVLRTDDLANIPAGLSESGIGLTRTIPSGVELALDSDPLLSFLAEVKRRNDYGQVPTGQILERHFGSPPFGAPVTVVQALTAASLRAGLVEIVYQGQRIGSAGDRRLDNVFRTLPAFRQCEIRPPQTSGPDVTVRTRLAKKLQEHTGKQQSPQLEELARQLRVEFGPKSKEVIRVAERLRGARLTVPTPVERAEELIARIEAADDAEVVTTASGGWEDLVSGLSVTQQLVTRLDEDLATLGAARDELTQSDIGLQDDIIRDRASLRDLLDAGDYLTHRGQVRALTDRIDAARNHTAMQLRHDLVTRIDEQCSEMDGDFETVDRLQREAIIQRFASLVPGDGASVEVLRARLEATDALAATTRRELEDVRSAGQIVEVHISHHVRGPIASAEQFDSVLTAVRAEAAAAFADGKEVRLV